MSDSLRGDVPSLACLREALGQTFRLEDANGNSAAVELRTVHEGVAMSPRYECYSAVFVLPDAMQAAQACYRLHHPRDANWTLMLTPIVPEAGRARLELVIHRERPD